MIKLKSNTIVVYLKIASRSIVNRERFASRSHDIALREFTQRIIFNYGVSSSMINYRIRDEFLRVYFVFRAKCIGLVQNRNVVLELENFLKFVLVSRDAWNFDRARNQPR